MAIESLVALGLATAVLLGVALYASSHRSEDASKKTKNQEETEE